MTIKLARILESYDTALQRLSVEHMAAAVQGIRLRHLGFLVDDTRYDDDHVSLGILEIVFHAAHFLYKSAVG